ncbi:MurR/RpiR family transcriptional regulator [Agromyces sp. SYSU T00194]|uniref:MurR/RpiR family transcriptional regulator n=1 Tax=Agromyces chitinivorans TaxID=3158560 RepID=UPI0033934176
MDESDVLTTVRRKYDELTHSQKRIAEAVVEDPEFVAFATVDKLADRLAVAPSTVVRFAYKIGFSGYPDLQERVRKVVRGQMRGAVGEGADQPTGVEHLAPGQATSLSHDLDNLRKTIAGLDADVLTAAVDAIVSARRVFLVGGYASGALAAYAALTLERVRDEVFLLENPGGPHMPLLFHAGPDDVLIAVGFAPYSTATVEAIELAKRRSLHVIGITDTPISPVGQRVDTVIASRVSGVAAQNSLVAPLAIVNVLLNDATARIEDAVPRYESIVGTLGGWGRFVLNDAGSGEDSAEQ